MNTFNPNFPLLQQHIIHESSSSALTTRFECLQVEKATLAVRFDDLGPYPRHLGTPRSSLMD